MIETRASGRSVGEPRKLAQRAAIGGRVGDDDVLEPLLRQPQRLGQRVGERPLKAGPREHPLLQRAAAHRLAGQPDRLGRGAAFHVGGVGPEGVEVDDRERRIERGRGSFEALERRHSSTGPSTRSV